MWCFWSSRWDQDTGISIGHPLHMATHWTGPEHWVQGESGSGPRLSICALEPGAGCLARCYMQHVACAGLCAACSACGTGSSLHTICSTSPRSRAAHGAGDAWARPGATGATTGHMLHVAHCLTALCAGFSTVESGQALKPVYRTGPAQLPYTAHALDWLMCWKQRPQRQTSSTCHMQGSSEIYGLDLAHGLYFWHSWSKANAYNSLTRN